MDTEDGDGFRSCSTLPGSAMAVKSSTSTRRTRRILWFAGRVQGVGFRQTTTSIAKGRDVTGWVRNEDDGRVQLVVEGRGAAVDAFLAELNVALGRYIHSMTGEEGTATGEFDGFSIRY